MIPIGPQSHNIDPLGDRRRLERSGKATPSQDVAKSGDTSNPEATQDDTLVRSDVNPEEVQRYVDVLKNMDPTDLHRVEDLRQSIEDGSYSSDLDELIDPLLNFLNDESDLG